MPYRKMALLMLLLGLFAASAQAYTIYLKDGSTIIARSEYTVEGDKAMILLESGTQTFLALDEIDVERTVEANKTRLGGALILKDGKFVERDEGDTSALQDRETVADLIQRGEATMRGTTRDPSDPDATLTGDAGTRLETVQRQPMRNIELATAIKAAFAARGLERVPVYQGTESSRPLVEVTTDSEASVFNSLEVAAEVMLEMQEEHAEDCDVMELLLMTGNLERAGEFALTTEMAESLKADEMEPSAFFVRNVRF